MSRAYVALQFALLILFAATMVAFPGTPLFAPPRAVGTAIALAGVVVVALGFVALGRNIQVAPHTKKGAHLVETGIYRVLRHPIYTGMAICIVGLWLRLPGPVAGASGAAVIVFLGVKRRMEERFLLAAYPGYEAYRKRTIAFP